MTTTVPIAGHGRLKDSPSYKSFASRSLREGEHSQKITRQTWNCVPEFLRQFPSDHLLLTDFNSDESAWPSIFGDYVEVLRVYTQEVASARDISTANAVRAANEVRLVPRPSLAAVPAVTRRNPKRGKRDSRECNYH